MSDLRQLWPTAGTIRRWPDRESWLAARLGALGGSDVAKVLGLSPYGSAWDVWAPRILGPQHRASTSVQRRGHHLEGGVLDWWAEETGAQTVGPLGTTTVEGPHPLVVTPDAAVQMHGQWGAYEGKTDTTGHRWGPSGTTIHAWTTDARQFVREDYAAQCYAVLAATGAPWCILAVLLRRLELRWYTIRRDERIQRRIVAACRRWWARHIEERYPPEVDGSDGAREALARLHPKTGRTGPALPHEAAFAEGLHRMREQHRVLGANIQTASTVLAAQIGGRGLDAIIWGDRGRPHRATRVVRTTDTGATVGVRVTIRED